MLSLMLVFVMANETDHRSVYDASSLCYSRYIYNKGKMHHKQICDLSHWPLQTQASVTAYISTITKGRCIINRSVICLIGHYKHKHQ